MKKILLNTSFLSVLLFATGAMAGFVENNTGGFKGPGVGTATVASVSDMRDDTPVVLEGYIQKNIGEEKYSFGDSTGTIVVEIDDEEWKGLNVTPSDLVVIKGEVEKDMFETEIDVYSIELKK